MAVVVKKKHNLRRGRKLENGSLPANKFGTLTGKLDHLTLAAHDGPRADDNHQYIWLKISDGQYEGKYECAVNTQSDDKSLVLYFELEEDVAAHDLPKHGFAEELFSYKEVKDLSDSDFIPVVNGKLRSLLSHYAMTCERISVVGFTYKEGNGIHDAHMNSGESAGSHHPNKKDEDGCAIFYFKNADGSYLAKWIFLKFQNQSLSR